MFAFLGHLRLGGGDTFADRLSSRYTFGIIIIIAIVSAAKVYLFNSISCKIPDHFTQSDNEYFNKVCWASSSYYLPSDVDEEYPHTRVSYHQWIPLMLAFQALLFYLPRRFWKQLGTKCGLSVSHVVDACLQSEQQSLYAAPTLAQVTDSVDRFLSQVNASNGCVKGAYLVVVYLMSKVLYLANLLFQLAMLNMFLKRLNYMYGIEALDRFIEGKGWRTSKTFPLVVICEVDITEMSQIKLFRNQCAMPINLFYEVAFTFLWLWFCYVAVCSLLSLLSWTFTSLIPSYQMRFVQRKLGGRVEKEGVARFVRERLRLDGCFVLQMVASNCNDVTTSQLISGLWERHTQAQQPAHKEIYPTIH